MPPLRRCLLLLFALCASCERRTEPGPASHAESTPGAREAPLPVPPASLAREGELRRGRRLEPVEYVSQRLAFTRHRFAYLSGADVIVHGLDDFAVVARFSVDDASNLAAVLGDDFVALGRERIHRLSAHEQRAEKLPRAPRVGLTTLWPSPLESEQLWLEYEGVPRLLAFDLKHTSEGMLLPTGFVTLEGFDRRALVLLRDTSVVYSAADGLRRVLAAGAVPAAAPERITVPELAAPVWRLLAADHPDRLWVLTMFHADLLELRPVLRRLARIELSPGTVTAASAGTRLALLISEGDPLEGRLRIEVREIGRPEPWTVHWLDAEAPTSATPGRAWPLELALAPRLPLVALGGRGVSVHDFVRGVAVIDAGRR
jgi:hypothetical protein